MKILVVEDEQSLGKAIVRGLTEEGHQVDLVTRGEEARERADELPYDVVVLDWSLPDLDGLSVLKHWRERGLQIPVLMLTARGTTKERVAGLRAGADDYLVKPFDFAELVARLEALHRRTTGRLESASLSSVDLDGRKRVLRHGTQEVALTPREYALAKELFSRAGEVLSRSHLLTTVWGTDFEGDPNVLDVYVGYVRKKLERIGVADVTLRAVRGVGFRLAQSTEEDAP